MILGVGIDLIEVARVRRSLEKFGDRFLHRILRSDEIAYCQSHRDPAPFVAARFAAKEAVSKAFGTGIGKQLGWQDIEVKKHPSGQPFVLLHDRGRDLLQDRHPKRLHLSISHTDLHATAIAVLEEDLPSSAPA